MLAYLEVGLLPRGTAKMDLVSEAGSHLICVLQASQSTNSYTQSIFFIQEGQNTRQDCYFLQEESRA